MNRVIVHDKTPVTLVGGGKVNKSRLKAAIAHGSTVVAADGAAKKLLKLGFVPEAVIGDFDSISQAAKAAIPPERLHLIEEQDSTDFEKCLAHIETPLVIGVGFSGGRIDHQLAVLHGLMRFADKTCLLLGRKDIVFLAPPALELDLPVESRVSLFPMGEVAARSDGLLWPLDGIRFAPGGRIGTSNRVSDARGGRVRIETDRPAMLVILPARQLSVAVRTLSDPATPRWPSR